jgi:hypothetical protein
MKKALTFVFTLLIGLGTGAVVKQGFEAYRSYELQAELDDQADAFKEVVATAEEGTKAIAMEEMAVEMLDKRLSSDLSYKEKKVSAMSVAIGAYSLQISRQKLCQSLGVDIKVFIDAYEQVNGEVITAAENFLFVENRLDKTDFYAMSQESEVSNIALTTDMDEIAKLVDGNHTDACQLFVSMAEEITEEMKILEVFPKVEPYFQ